MRQAHLPRTLHNLYLRLLTNSDFKHAFAERYAANEPLPPPKPQPSPSGTPPTNPDPRPNPNPNLNPNPTPTQPQHYPEPSPSPNRNRYAANYTQLAAQFCHPSQPLDEALFSSQISERPLPTPLISAPCSAPNR